MEAVMSQSLSNGKRVEIGHFHRLIGSAVLGFDIEKYPQEWSKGWTKNLKEKLGFEGFCSGFKIIIYNKITLIKVWVKL